MTTGIVNRVRDINIYLRAARSIPSASSSFPSPSFMDIRVDEPIPIRSTKAI